MFSDIYLASRDIELIILWTIYSREQYGHFHILPKMNAQFVVNKPVTKFIKFGIKSIRKVLTLLDVEEVTSRFSCCLKWFIE